MFDKDRLDEDLITAVKNKPALYDFRLPLKQRGRKQKDDLWNEVSVQLKGKIILIILSYIKQYVCCLCVYACIYVYFCVLSINTLLLWCYYMCLLYIVGLYTPSEAEKRWNYLKDCYRKAKNALKKRQAIQQRNDTVDIPKSEAIMPSFRHYNLMTFLNDTLEYRQ